MRLNLTTLLLSAIPVVASAADPQTVHFQSEDHRTRLVGYLFAPEQRGPHPAIVLLHGRAGPYSSLANGTYDASTLSKRHKEWGHFWADRGYAALLVDSFGPRGYPAGFPKGSYKDRPPEVSEQTVRPLDAYGALRYLRTRPDILRDRIGVQGWSNGGMTVLVTIGSESPGISDPSTETGFRAALAEYPGCQMESVRGEYRPYAPLTILIASADEEVSPKACEAFAKKAQGRGAEVRYKIYEGAEHNFDDPGRKKQSNPANQRATEDAMRVAERFFAAHLEGR